MGFLARLTRKYRDWQRERDGTLVIDRQWDSKTEAMYAHRKAYCWLWDMQARLNRDGRITAEQKAAQIISDNYGS